MNSRKNFMAVALWILSAGVVAGNKPPQPAPDKDTKAESPKNVK